MESKPVIYISSTYFDLKDHRAKLIEALQKTRSFEVRCMENYGTISKPPLQQCLEDVGASEFYILLVGRRYGYIPQGEELSITNLEYREAASTGKKCLLPFLLDENYKLDPAISQEIMEEEGRDGSAITEDKRTKLQALQSEVKTQYTLEKFFTSPEDLVGKVFGALIPELVRRNYASLLNQIKLSEEIAYRCNRDTPRNQFLGKNARMVDFIKVFIIHGESAELPDIFSNNISYYELKTSKYYEVNSLTKFISTTAESPYLTLAIDLHAKIFGAVPQEESFSLEQLCEKIYLSPEKDNVVIRIQVSYKSWKENAKGIELLFAEIKRINKPQNNKGLYLLVNVIYRSEQESGEALSPSDVVINKLEKIDISDVDGWVKTYFFLDNNKVSRDKAALLARKICKKYFPDYFDTEDRFCMEEAIEVLRTVVDDFNGNKELFTNYVRLYN